MAYSVLILDDDADFNSLLTDIFGQADYDVTSLQDPIEAVEVFAENDYDLVVTDHKMPEMTGVEFIKEIKNMKPEVPVVMVSGYLENDTIRELIREGVGGVFLKPLNIFSLLGRTTELIEEAKKMEEAQGGETVRREEDSDEADGQHAQLGFAFRSFPCKSDLTIDFADRLYSLRNFKSTISLIGHPGTHYRQICEDLRRFYESDQEHFVYFDRDSFVDEQVLSKLREVKSSGAERVTCVLIDVEHFNMDQRSLAASLPKCEGVFESLDLNLRAIFCVSDDLDNLYDDGLIDENLYILMGTAEVRVPALKECPDDLLVIAEQIIAEVARENGLPFVPHFERSAREFLRKCDWPGNYAELSDSMRSVIDKAKGDVLTLEALKASCASEVVCGPQGRLRDFMEETRIDYLRAATLLYDSNRMKVASFFGANTASVENVLH